MSESTREKTLIFLPDQWSPPTPRFNADDAERAHKEWGCNCGPAAVAAVSGLTLDQVRAHMGDFETKGYTNPTLMWGVLRSIGVKFAHRSGNLGREGWPWFGLARIQWEGPWTKPGVPPQAAYRQTHWVGVLTTNRLGVGIFDVNTLNNGTGWLCLDDWRDVLVPWLLKECHPRADGGWHITHAVEITHA